VLSWIAEYGMFVAKVITISLSVIAVFLSVIVVSASQKGPSSEGSISLKNLNNYYKDLKDELYEQLLSKEQQKAYKKENKEKKKSKDQKDTKPRLFVIDFDGDIKASGTDALAKEINSILSVADEKDHVMLRLESPGGVVHGYGLAASQLQRLKDNNIPLTICVDKVAASGGYMMACVADKIIAAPFAVIGSIGVVAQIPNFNKLLKKNDVDFDIYTAGEYKRTVTMFGENTQEGKSKLNDDLQVTHELFQNMIQSHREVLDVPQVATGEVWYGTQALDKKLIDKVGTSDDFILSHIENYDVYSLSFVKKKTLSDKIGLGAANAMSRAFLSFHQTSSKITG
jgi:serine protease SohB